VQDAPAIGQANYALSIKALRIDPRDLGRHIWAQAQCPPGQLVSEFERAQIKVAAASDRKRIQMLDQWRLNQLITVGSSQIEQMSAQLFDLARFGRQHIGEGFGQ
jgi:hypothetical protein